MAHHRRKSSIDRVSIESILKPAEATQPAAPPSPHVGSSPSRARFAMSPPPGPGMRHSRALSYTPRRPNRLSLSFPVAASSGSNESSRPTPTSSNATSFPATPAEVQVISPNDSGDFLVALASQERRVLELKEELHKAETDLAKLKKQWALHEAHKKKAEIRNVEQLQPLQPVVPESNNNEEPATALRQSAEFDRRKALLGSLNIPKETRRKFSGAHTRQLSLLSPERSNFTRSIPQGSSTENSPFQGSTTIPDTSQGITRVSSNRSYRNSYHAGMTHGAKQIAEDIKAGMWTFLEDLRQATVGEEGVNGTINRSTVDPPKSTPARRGSKGSLLGNDKGRRDKSPRNASPRTWDSLTGNNTAVDGAGGTWDEGNTRSPSKPPTSKKTFRPLSLAPAIDDLDDDWANWDSPTPKSPRWSGSSTLSDPATPLSGNGEDRNVKIIEQSTDEPSTLLKRDEIQWPALDKLSASNIKGNLQRTMSTILKEWEKTITPPPIDSSDPMKTTLQGREKTSGQGVESSNEDVILMSR